MEHTDAAQVAALLGAVGAVLVLVPRNRFLALAGFALLGLATAGLGRSLVGDDDIELLVTEPAGVALIGVGVVAAALGAIPLVRYPAAVPVVLLAAAPFRIPVQVGEEDAFLLLPLYLVLAAAVLALAYRTLRGELTPAPPSLLGLPIAAFAAFAAASFLWTWDEREGGIALAFFVFPFVAGFGVVARAPLAPWLPRALVFTLAALGSLFAAIGLWQAQTRTLFFSPTLEVANAYTSFFRVTSLFKDPSLYGRYLVVPIAVLLVALLVRRIRTSEWVAMAALVAFLFAGLYYSYSQSSFVALFAVVFAVAFFAGDRRLRVILVVCAVVATLTAGAFAAQAIEGRSARDVTSGRSRLINITLDAFELRPVAGVGIGGQPRASAEATGRRSTNRNASHTTPLTVLAELGIVGFGLYLWVLGAAAWGIVLVTRENRAFGVALAAVLLVLVVHSLLYAGFFEDPLTWGVFGLTAAALAASPARAALGAPVSAEAVTDRSGAAGTLDPAGATRFLFMPRNVKWIAAAAAVLLLVLAGLLAALWVTNRDRSQGALETDTGTISVSSEERPDPVPPPEPEPEVDKLCWPAFGGDPLRSLSRPDVNLTLPPRKPTWSRALGDLMEYPPTYCNGRLYVNLEHGKTVALNANTGKVVWIRRSPGLTVSSPAIAGDRLIVSSHGGTVTAFRRTDGARLWQLRADAAFESSPVAVDGVAFVGADDGRLYALDVETGKPHWVYNLGGRISSSPSVVGGNVCITTYSGAVGCVRRTTGERVWVRYFKRDALRYESFYASPSSDGRRIYTVSRAGRVLALDAATGDDVWQASTGSLTYGTPAIADGRIFVGDLGRTFQAFRASDGRELWEIEVPGRVLGPALVVGDFVFFSTLEQDTLAARVEDGKIAWRLGIGKYAPGIATERRYYFSLNGRIVVWDAARRSRS